MLYLARRLLNFTANQWQALPWWQRHLYTSKMMWELERGGIFNRGGPGGGGEGSGVREHTDLSNASQDELAGLGITVS